jgi:transcriptional regulator with XRE-family HTH domain
VKSHTPKVPRNVIGPQVRKYRKLHKWSQATLAAKCQVFTAAGWHITRDVVALIESRARWIGDFELVLLANVLKVPITDLIPEHINWQNLPVAKR